MRIASRGHASTSQKVFDNGQHGLSHEPSHRATCKRTPALLRRRTGRHPSGRNAKKGGHNMPLPACQVLLVGVGSTAHVIQFCTSLARSCLGWRDSDELTQYLKPARLSMAWSREDGARSITERPRKLRGQGPSATVLLSSPCHRPSLEMPFLIETFAPAGSA